MGINVLLVLKVLFLAISFVQLNTYTYCNVYAYAYINNTIEYIYILRYIVCIVMNTYK